MFRSYTITDKKLVETSGMEAPILCFVNPDEAEQQALKTRFMVDAHTLLSALDPDEPPRYEIEPSHTAIIFKRPKNYSGEEKFLFKVTSLGLFLYKDRLIAVMPEDAPILNGKSFSQIESIEELFLKILSVSIHHYLEHLKVITQITDEIEGLISSSMENRYLLNLFSLEKSLVYYLSAINSNGFTLERLKTAAPRIGLSELGVEFLDDLVIENTQCYRQAEIYSNILASLMDARVSIVSNNLNMLMKTLNLVTIVIMVPTLVVSAFSMNIAIPLQKHPYAFLIVMLLSALSVGCVVLWWWRISNRLRRNGN